jgi:hypothetical protein
MTIHLKAIMARKETTKAAMSSKCIRTCFLVGKWSSRST